MPVSRACPRAKLNGRLTWLMKPALKTEERLAKTILPNKENSEGFREQAT